MRAHDGRVEHLDQMRGRTHRGERVEEGFENVSLAQSVEAFPHAVPSTKAFRQRPPSDVFDGEEMKGFEEPPVILGLPSTWRKAGAKHHKRVRPISSFIFVDMRSGPRFGRRPSCRIQLGNPKNIICQNFVHTA
jgi:hypothetical protein